MNKNEPTNKSIGKQRSVFYKIILPTLISIMLVFLIYQSDIIDDYYWIVFCLGFPFVYPYYWLREWMKRCPKCNCWSADEILEKKLLDYNDRISNVSETTTENNISTTHHFKKTYTTWYYKLTHKCKFCEYVWETKKTETSSEKERL